MNPQTETLLDLLQAGDPGAHALSSPDAPPLTYDALRRLGTQTAENLRVHGLAHNDRVAMVLDNGPCAATAFLCVALGATTAPLNPAYRADEFEFYLSDLNAKLLIVESGRESPAIQVAGKLGIPVARLQPLPAQGAGQFALTFAQSRAPDTPAARPPSPEDIALVLHTSGTTSRPKMVPLSHRSICISARNVRETLAFSAADRGLNVMPLFHIHGLIAGILAPLSAGGEVFCTPGFNALKFFSWMAQAHPTWYSAVPTMHQAILSRADKSQEVIRANPLRFIRSSSSSLPPSVIEQLERVFAAPVIEAYSMTEAAHQMTSNPLPPGKRKPGTVGRAAGPEVCILDDAGRPAEPGIVGEIAIRGRNVTSGYANNAKANSEAFVNGWFRTGDQGVLDGEGYVTVTGRLKEIINRGGEKISPREVDEILLTHPAVAQCVTFAVPHQKLGEAVAAAVVLREGMTLSEAELRAFAAVRLADFKVPSQIVFLPEIPKGPTGKLQRIGLAQKLGIS